MNIILYVLCMVGLFLLFSSSIQSFIEFSIGKLIQHKRIRSHFNEQSNEQSDQLMDHLRTLIKTTLGEIAGNHANVIVTAVAIIAAVSFITVRQEQSSKFSMLVAASVMVIPYFILQLRLYSIRVESSYEGEFFITELINQYKLNHLNMIEAIDATVIHLKDSPRTRKLLFTLSIRIKSYQDIGELEVILTDFTYGIDTQWSRMVANNLLLSIEEGFEVTSGLIDIQQELKRAKSAYEKSSRNTTEGFAIVKVLIPLLYVFTIFLSVKYFNFTIDKFMYYQIGTPGGMKLLMLNLLLYLFNVMLMILFQRRRFDIT